MIIFKDSVSGAEKKHILWQHYINGDYFLNNEVRVYDDPRLILPSMQGGKKITLATLHRWLNSVIARLDPKEQIILRAIYIENNGCLAKDGLYDEQGVLLETQSQRILKFIQNAIKEKNKKFINAISSSDEGSDYQQDRKNAFELRDYMDIVRSKASVENILKRALNEKRNVLNSSKEKATMFFSCLAGFVSASVPGISLGALGYALIFGGGFALVATPVGWLIGGAALFGLVGATAVYCFNYYNKKHDDRSHKLIYAKKDSQLEKIDQMHQELTTLAKVVKKLEQSIVSLQAKKTYIRREAKNIPLSSISNEGVVHRFHCRSRKTATISKFVARQHNSKKK